MLLKSKYIFETKQTKSRRFFKNILFLIASLAILYILFCLFIILFARNQNQLTEDFFYQRPPGLIVIFTGDVGRIPFGLKMAKDFQQPNIFITGVYSRNTVESLLRPMEENLIQDINLLNIDYHARNTVENVLSTLRFLRQSNVENDILIVSHDYHIMRIRMIINRLKDPNDNHRFMYYGLEADYTKRRNLRILTREVFKLIRAYGFLLLWDPERSSNYIQIKLD